ncbi:hypothetical protein HOT32_gp38 [Erwinia phage Faunus]|uniref:Uncharacterized protein n=1 Tax=Erwinia phage Faunus TaxID=2182346 RepID=A0A2U8UWJ2_9CAUD|nr:hypothetical protein HOT32_gp38 [Erwinia phage Faunus]AWN08621.1 hypothetical protein [Erwinia phage Faunus]
MAFAAPTLASNKTPSAAPLLEAGGYPARVCRIIDLGLQPGSAKYPNPQLKLLVTFELLEEFMKEVDAEGKMIMVQDPDEDEGVMMAKNLEDKPRWFDFEFSYNADGFMGDNSHIYKFAKAIDALEVAANLEQNIVGHPAKDLKDWLTEPLIVGLTQYTKQSGKNAGQVSNKVATFSPMKTKEKREAKALVNPTVFFDMSHPDLEIFNKLPGGDSEWAIKNRITSGVKFNETPLAALLGVAGASSQTPVNQATDEQVDEAMQAELAAQKAAREKQAAENAATGSASNQPF